MNDNELLALAQEAGFEHYAILDPATLDFRQDVRDMCNPQGCQYYNSSWSCPPALEDVSVYAEKARKYTRGLLVQSEGKMEDSFDFEAIEETGKLHKERFNAVNKRMKELFEDVWPMGMGTCTICEKCTYPDNPCRFPDKMQSSMEAYGLLINSVCVKNGLQYNYGPGTMSFASCWLF